MQYAEPVQLRQVRDFSQIIATTITFLKQNWRQLFRAIAIFSLPTALIGGFLAGGSVAGLQRMSMTPGGDPTAILENMGSSVIGMIPGYILLMFGYVVLVAVVHEYLRAYHLGEHMVLGPGDLLKRAFSQLGSYFGASFLIGLLSVVAIILCILPVFYVMTVLSLALMAHAIERTGGSGALARSNKLVQGDFWPTLGLVLVVGIINYLLNVVVQLPFTIVNLVVGINTGMDMVRDGGSSGFPSWYGIFMSIGVAIQWSAMMLTYPIVAVAMGLKYFSRVEETEGHGLKERIAGFEQA